MLRLEGEQWRYQLALLSAVAFGLLAAGAVPHLYNNNYNVSNIVVNNNNNNSDDDDDDDNDNNHYNTDRNWTDIQDSQSQRPPSTIVGVP